MCVDRSPPLPPRLVGSPQGPRYRSRGSRAAPSWPTRWGCPHTPGQRGSVQPSALLSEHSEHKAQMLWLMVNDLTHLLLDGGAPQSGLEGLEGGGDRGELLVSQHLRVTRHVVTHGHGGLHHTSQVYSLVLKCVALTFISRVLQSISSNIKVVILKYFTNLYISTLN